MLITETNVDTMSGNIYDPRTLLVTGITGLKGGGANLSTDSHQSKSRFKSREILPVATRTMEYAQDTIFLRMDHRCSIECY